MLPLSRCDLDGGYGNELDFGFVSVTTKRVERIPLFRLCFFFGSGLCFASGAVWSALVVFLVFSIGETHAVPSTLSESQPPFPSQFRLTRRSMIQIKRDRTQFLLDV